MKMPAGAVSSTSADLEATPGDEEYYYSETFTLPADFYTDYGNYDVFIDLAYSFERTVYMYIWGNLVIITFLVNILVISVLLRKKMRNLTNMILTAIAISDSLTGLVTLPSYWVVYSKYQTAETVDYVRYYDTMNISGTTDAYDTNLSNAPIEFSGARFLTKSLCRTFMISKYFLSKTFHTVSIWLTLFLGFQRFISVATPFRVQKLFCKRNVLIICVVILVAAPVLHVYHLVDSGMCQLGRLEENCVGRCANLIIIVLLRHLVPCILLVIFTVAFIIHLKSSSSFNRTDSNRGNAAMEHRDGENRRISLIVTIIVIVFLIPEVHFGGYLLYVLIGNLTHVIVYHETMRAIHLAYEVSLVISFHANFYIFTFFNRRFRKALLRGIVYPILTCCGKTSLCGIKAIKDIHSGKTSYTTITRRRTLQSGTGTRIELNDIGTCSNSAGRSTSVTKPRQFVNGKPQEEQENIEDKSNCLSQEADLSDDKF